jgi:hypothetical protein
MAKCDCARQFILADKLEKQLQKVNKTASTTEHTEVAAKL